MAFDKEKAEEISRPTLMVHAPGWTGRKPFVEEWFPEADYHVVPGVTHGLQMEDPRAVAEGISDFLRRHPLDECSDP